MASGYCHANIGPEETRAGNLLLEVEAEVQNAVPNFTMKYEAGVTPDDFARKAIRFAMRCANPAFANHAIHKHTYEGDYQIVSCYNVLPYGGGAYCLDRLLLPGTAKLATSVDDFMDNVLPEATLDLCNYINQRIRFEIEKYARGEVVLADTSHDGEGNWRANDLGDRTVRL